MFHNLASKYRRTCIPVLLSLIAWAETNGTLITEATTLSADTLHATQRALPDSIVPEPRELQEVVVTSESVRRKGNLTELYPGKRDRRFAAGAVDVLTNMNVPEVTVDPLSGSVKTTDGEPVAMFIDFQPASSQQLREVRPQDIMRIDLIRSPSDPRFQGARAVANFIMKKYEYGGYTKFDGTQCVPLFSSRYSLYSKFSYKRMSYDVSTGLGYSRQGKRSGSEKSAVYSFVTGEIERRSRTSALRSRALTPQVSARAIYNASGISISNLAAFNFSRKPSLSRGVVEYSSLYGDAESEESGIRYGRNVVWNGDYYFQLPREWAMSFTGSLSWGVNTDNSSYVLTGNVPIVNDIREDIFDSDGQVALSKRFRAHRMSLYGAGGWSRNRLDYMTVDHKDVCYREGYGQVGARVAFSFDGFMLTPSLRLALSSEKMNGDSYTRLYPKGFMPFYVQLTRVSSLSGSLEFAVGGPDATLRSPVLLRINEIDAVRGNDDLDNYRYYNARIGYSHYFGPWLALRADAACVCEDNILVPTYSGGITAEGNPLMIRDVTNDGSKANSSLTVSLSGKYLDNRLSVNLSGYLGHYLQRGSVRRHEWIPGCWMSASWYVGDFRINAYFTTPSKSCSQWGEARTLVFWYVGGAYSYRDLYVELRFSNPFRTSYVDSRTSYSSPQYEYEETLLSPMRHQCLRLTLSYSIGYGRKVSRQDEVGTVEAGESIILKKK